MAQRRLTVVIDSDETECGFCFHMTCAAEKNGKLIPPYRCSLFIEDLGDPPLKRVPACLAAEKGEPLV